MDRIPIAAALAIMKDPLNEMKDPLNEMKDPLL
jgi:hypothetical protein